MGLSTVKRHRKALSMVVVGGLRDNGVALKVLCRCILVYIKQWPLRSRGEDS